MTQEATIELLSDYLDGELTDAEVAELENRLARDPALQQELDQLRAAVDLLRTHGPVQAPPSLYASVMHAVDDEPVAGGFWRWLQRPFGIPLQTLVVAAVAVLVIGVSVGGVLTVQGLELGATREIVASTEPSDAGDESETKAATKAVGKTDGDADGDADGVADAEPPAAAETQGPLPAGDAVADVGEEWDERGTAEPEEAAQAPAAVGTSVVAKEKLAIDKMGYEGNVAQNAMPVGTGEDETVGDAASSLKKRAKASGTSDKGEAGKYYVSPMQHKLTLREQDLPIVAKLYQRYAGRKSSAKVADAIVDAPPGTQTLFPLEMPNAAARNQFLSELKRTFPGSFTEIVTNDDTITMDSATVNLVLFVSDYAPSGQKDAGQIQTLRSRDAEGPDDAEQADEPAASDNPAK